MPTYNYECCDCLKKLTDSLNRPHTIDEYEQYALFETSHSMSPTKSELSKACVCPRCHGNNCERSFHGSEIIGYVRGNGMLDKVGAHRDMNLFKLTEEDPYANMRVAGEVDEMKNNIKKAGRRQSKRIYSVPKESESSMKEAVTKSVFTK